VLALYQLSPNSAAAQQLRATAAQIKAVLGSQESDVLFAFEITNLGITLRLGGTGDPLSVAGGIRLVQYPSLLDAIFTGSPPELIVGSSGTSMFIELRPVPPWGLGSPRSSRTFGSCNSDWPLSTACASQIKLFTADYDSALSCKWGKDATKKWTGSIHFPAIHRGTTNASLRCDVMGHKLSSVLQTSHSHPPIQQPAMWFSRSPAPPAGLRLYGALFGHLRGVKAMVLPDECLGFASCVLNVPAIQDLARAPPSAY
jgi:hypothetical protein